MQALFALVLVCMTTWCHGQDKPVYPPIPGHEREWHLSTGNPGIRIRLTKKGANHIKKVMMNVLAKEATNVENVNIYAKIGRGSLTLEEMKVTEFRKPRLTVVNFIPRRSVAIGMEDMDIAVAGRFIGEDPPFKVPGTLSGKAFGATVVVVMDLFRQPGGGLRIIMSSCKTVIPRTRFKMKPEGPFAAFIEPYKPYINSQLKTGLPQIFCRALKKAVESGAEDMFTEFADTKIDDFKKPDSTGAGVADDFIQRMTHGLLFNTRLTDHPLVTKEYIELPIAGEMRYNTSPITPFFPKKMGDIVGDDKMLYIAASDYVLNTLLYHAYTQNRLKLTLKQANVPSQFRGVFRTTCGGKKGKGKGSVYNRICMGSLIPAIAQNHPNTITEVDMLPHGLPVFSFIDEKGKIDGRGRILIYDMKGGRRKQLMVIGTELSSDLRILPKVKNGRIQGDFKLNKLKLDVWRSSVNGVNPRNVQQLSPVAKTMLTPEMAKALEHGLPLPFGDSVEYRDPEIQITDGMAVFASDLKLKQEVVDEMVSNAIHEGLEKAQTKKGK